MSRLGLTTGVQRLRPRKASLILRVIIDNNIIIMHLFYFENMSLSPTRTRESSKQFCAIFIMLIRSSLRWHVITMTLQIKIKTVSVIRAIIVNFRTTRGSMITIVTASEMVRNKGRQTHCQCQ